MRQLRLLLAAVAFGVLTVGLSAAEQNSAGKVEKIGVYDSRSVAVAFAGSEAHKRWMAPLIEEHRQAKAAGDTKRTTELEAEGAARQKRMHAQGFGTAPVDDILKHIEDQLPGIKSKAGVADLISKWDKTSLAKHKAGEPVDITLALVDAFKPSEKQRKLAIEIQQQKPMD